MIWDLMCFSLRCPDDVESCEWLLCAFLSLCVCVCLCVAWPDEGVLALCVFRAQGG